MHPAFDTFQYLQNKLWAEKNTHKYRNWKDCAINKNYMFRANATDDRISYSGHPGGYKHNGNGSRVANSIRVTFYSNEP